MTLGAAMVAIAILALVSAVVVQSIRLREAARREARLQEEIDAMRDLAIVNELNEQIAREWAREAKQPPGSR
jgi:hypothetical protein